MRVPLRSLPILLLLMLGTSCASIVTGSTDSVTIQSAPPGAYFTTNTGIQGVTPRVVTVPASQDLVVDFRLQGYEPASAVLESRMSGWVWGNLIFGGLVGIVIDGVNPDSRTHDKVLQTKLVRNLSEPTRAQARTAEKTKKASMREAPREININHWD